LGPIPMQRVVGSHFVFFSELKASGASWEQIAALLEREGLRNRRGCAVSTAVLRTTYARALNERKVASAAPAYSAAISSQNSGYPDHHAIGATESGGASNGSLKDTMTRTARLRGIL
ncbi:MAG: hypothetical protein ABJN42_15060, partial [Roseibium sp.]|uniref:hypothetical protein n=1 Tax=Roseibium sp. TaxID=1936156 RepID=UPI00329981F0